MGSGLAGLERFYNVVINLNLFNWCIFLSILELLSLLGDYEKLKEERTCKICMDAESSVVFLPCGHIVCCSSCAPVLRTCPICRSYIKGSVRAYMP